MNKLSLLCNTLVNHGFQLIILIGLLLWIIMRPLGVFFLAILTAWIFLSQCNLRVVPPPDFINILEQLKSRVQGIRQTKPKMFYFYSTSCLSILAILGNYISDMTVIISGMVVSSVLMTKYRFRIIKVERKDFAIPSKSLHDTAIDDEFMPEENESNLCVLEQASDMATIASLHDDGDETEEDKSDEVPSELLIPDTIPEIDETYTDEDDEDVEDLIPILSNGININKASNNRMDDHRTNIVSDLESSNDAYQIAFKKGHFKRDSSLSTTSSSSDEESLSKGLQFPDHTAVDGGRAVVRQRQVLPSVVASDLVALTLSSPQLQATNNSKLIPSLLYGLGRVIAGGARGDGEGSGDTATRSLVKEKRVVTALDSSDESDFEILDNEDFK